MRDRQARIIFCRLYLLIVILFIFPKAAISAGAVAAQRQKGAKQKQVVQEGLLIRQQAAASAAASLAQNGLPIETTVDIPTSMAVSDRNINIYWEQLKKSSAPWPKIKEEETKKILISKFIDIYKTQNIYINKSPERYIKLIDKMLEGKPSLLSTPLLEVLMIVAVFEYDFDNGQDKDVMVDRIFEKYGSLP